MKLGTGFERVERKYAWPRALFIEVLKELVPETYNSLYSDVLPAYKNIHRKHIIIRLGDLNKAKDDNNKALKNSLLAWAENYNMEHYCPK